MNYHIVLLPKVRQDILSARTWYAEQSPGLEDDYWEEIHLLLLQIADNPVRFSFADPVSEIRGARAKRFPYKVYYYINEAMHRIEVIAILHKARNPKVWKRRL